MTSRTHRARVTLAGVALLLCALLTGACSPRVARLDAATPPPARAAGTGADVSSATPEHPGEPRVHWRNARRSLERGSRAAAEAALDSALAVDPAYAPALSLRARLDWDAGRHDEAVARLESALARPGAFPDGAPVELEAALALHEGAAGAIERAEARLDSLDAGHPAVLTARAWLALRGDHPEHAGAVVERALAANDRSAANHNNAGLVRLRAGDPHGARTAFLRAIELDPALPGPYYNLAIVEKFYLFDDAAAARWHRAYRERAREDRDGLERVFGPDASPGLAEGSTP